MCILHSYFCTLRNTNWSRWRHLPKEFLRPCDLLITRAHTKIVPGHLGIAQTTQTLSAFLWPTLAQAVVHGWCFMKHLWHEQMLMLSHAGPKNDRTSFLILDEVDLTHYLNRIIKDLNQIWACLQAYNHNCRNHRKKSLRLLAQDAVFFCAI